MADYTQTQVELANIQQLTHPGSVVETAVSVAGDLFGKVYVWLGNEETTANATAPSVLIQVSPDSSGNNWVTIAELLGSTTASETEALTATEPVAETVMAVASTTNLVVGDKILITDATAVTDYEFHEIVDVVANTSVTLMDGLAAEKQSGDDIYDQAKFWAFDVDLAGVDRMRMVVVHEAATGSNLVFKGVCHCASAIE